MADLKTLVLGKKEVADLVKNSEPSQSDASSSVSP